MLTDWRSRPVVVCSEVCAAAVIALMQPKARARKILCVLNIEKFASKEIFNHGALMNCARS
jgi:hypothetical protein